MSQSDLRAQQPIKIYKSFLGCIIFTHWVKCQEKIFLIDNESGDSFDSILNDFYLNKHE